MNKLQSNKRTPSKIPGAFFPNNHNADFHCDAITEPPSTVPLDDISPCPETDHTCEQSLSECTNQIVERLEGKIDRWRMFWLLFKEACKIQSLAEFASISPKWRVRQRMQAANQKLTRRDILLSLHKEMKSLLHTMRLKQEVAAYDSIFFQVANESINKLVDGSATETDMQDFMNAEKIALAENPCAESSKTI